MDEGIFSLYSGRAFSQLQEICLDWLHAVLPRDWNDDSNFTNHRMNRTRTFFFVAIALCSLTACNFGGGNHNAKDWAAQEKVRQALHGANQNLLRQNRRTAMMTKSGINEQVAQGDSKAEFLLKHINKLEEKTDQMTHYLENLLRQLAKMGGGYDFQPFDKPDGNVANQTLWGLSPANEGRGDGEAHKLREKLNGYIDFANDMKHQTEGKSSRSQPFGQIAIDPGKDPDAPNYEDKTKPWEVATFEGTNVITDLVTLERLRQSVLQVENEILEVFLSASSVQPTFKVDSLAFFDIPRSRVVAAGMKFETTLAVAMFDSEVRPEFIGSGVRANPGGTSATLSMTAPGGFPIGQHQKEVNYGATVKLSRADGDIVDMQLQGKYTVVKPEAVFESKSVQNLYFQCGNTFSLDVPLLGEFYSPKFAASDAEVLQSSSDKRTVTVVPKGTTSVVALSSLTNGQSIKIVDLTFRVIAPPLPRIRLMVDGKEYNGMDFVDDKSELIVKVIPDEGFRNGFPLDARYIIDQFDVFVQASIHDAPLKVGTVSGAGKDATIGIPLSLGPMLKDVAAGSNCYLILRSVNRVNFQNRLIMEKLDQREKVIGFVVN